MAEANQKSRIGLCVLCGLPGAGKSTLAAALKAEQSLYTIVVISYDAIIQEDAFQAQEPCQSRELSCLTMKSGERESQWKNYRQHVLQCLEHLIASIHSGSILRAPSGNIKGSWERFCECLECQGLISTAGSGSRSQQYFINFMNSPLYFLLDDNFYYRSMRYEVCQLARKYSLAFCQLYLHCPIESCLLRNRSRQEHVTDETILLMERKIETPNPEKNMWEMNSLLLDSSGEQIVDDLRIISLLNRAMENPARLPEEDNEEKARDREICAANLLHQADQSLRRLISETMQTLKGSLSAQDIKRIAQELQCVKSKALEQLRHHITLKTVLAANGEQNFSVHSFFIEEKERILQPYLCHLQMPCS